MRENERDDLHQRQGVLALREYQPYDVDQVRHIQQARLGESPLAGNVIQRRVDNPVKQVEEAEHALGRIQARLADQAFRPQVEHAAVQLLAVTLDNSSRRRHTDARVRKRRQRLDQAPIGRFKHSGLLAAPESSRLGRFERLGRARCSDGIDRTEDVRVAFLCEDRREVRVPRRPEQHRGREGLVELLVVLDGGRKVDGELSVVSAVERREQLRVVRLPSS